jgi:hypothetical protein
MRQVMSLIAGCVVLGGLLAPALAADLTEQQVKDTCGGKLQSASYSDGTKASVATRNVATPSARIIAAPAKNAVSRDATGMRSGPQLGAM